MNAAQLPLRSAKDGDSDNKRNSARNGQKSRENPTDLAMTDIGHGDTDWFAA
ncbi:MAG: hypothetical protein WBN32_14425 [Woeseia sp.]